MTVRVRTRARVPRRSWTSSPRTACSSTASSSTPRRRRLQDGQPGHRGGRSPRSPRPARPTSTARSRAARDGVRAGLGSDARAGSGPSTCSGSPGSSRSAPASWRCWRSLDNGKPIRESRDVDVPLVAAHFFYYAGWADKLALRRASAPTPAPLGVAGQVIPWNFPLLMLAWKIAPALAAGNTVRAQAGRDHPADRAAVRRDLPAGRPAARRGQHRHRRRRAPAGALVEHPGVDKVAFTGSTEVGRADRPVGGRHRQAAHPGAGRQGRQHRLRRRPDRPGRRGHRQRHLLQPGARLLRGLAAAGAGVGRRRRCWTALKRRMAHAARRRPAGQEHRHRRDQLGRRSWTGSASCPTPARPRARSAGRRRASCPTGASGSRRRSSPGSPSRTGSPGRRSSGRCCRC